MKALAILLFSVSAIFCNATLALSASVAPATIHLSVDSTVLPVENATKTSVKKSWFANVKDKLAAFFGNRKSKKVSEQSTKATLGLIALGLVGFALLSPIIGFGNGILIGCMLLGGFVLGLVSLFIPRNKYEKEHNKKGSKVGLIAVGLVIGIAAVFIIALSTVGHR